MRNSAEAGEFETFRHKKALCQSGVQDIDTRRQEGFENAARFAKRVMIAMVSATKGAEYIRSNEEKGKTFVVIS